MTFANSLMLRATLLSLVASILVLAFAVQEPLVANHHRQDKHLAIVSNDDLKEWCLDEIPDPSATDHLVFGTVYSLLQHWPNLRMRNGK